MCVCWCVCVYIVSLLFNIKCKGPDNTQILILLHPDCSSQYNQYQYWKLNMDFPGL